MTETKVLGPEPALTSWLGALRRAPVTAAFLGRRGRSVRLRVPEAARCVRDQVATVEPWRGVMEMIGGAAWMSLKVRYRRR